MAKRRKADRRAGGDAERQRRRRERAAAGLVRVEIWVDEVNLSALLVGAGFLAVNLADDRAAISEATARLIAALTIAEIHSPRHA